MMASYYLGLLNSSKFKYNFLTVWFSRETLARKLIFISYTSVSAKINSRATAQFFFLVKSQQNKTTNEEKFLEWSDLYNFQFFFKDRNFPNTLIEMKRLAEDSQRFRVEDVPPRLHEKERVAAAFRDIEKQLRESGEQIDRNLHPESIDGCWNQLMMVYKERDQMIHEEIAR